MHLKKGKVEDEAVLLIVAEEEEKAVVVPVSIKLQLNVIGVTN